MRNQHVRITDIRPIEKKDRNLGLIAMLALAAAFGGFLIWNLIAVFGELIFRVTGILG